MRHILSNDWLLLIVVFSLILMISAKFLNASKFNSFLKVLFRSKYATPYFKNFKLAHPFNSILFINFCVNSSVFIYLLFISYNGLLVSNTSLFFCVVGLVFSYILGTQLLTIILTFIGKTKTNLHIFAFIKLTCINYFGIIVWFVNLLLIYTSLSKLFLLVLTVMFLIIILLLVGVANINTIVKPTRRQKFYFLLYLCTLEISPYFFVSSLLGLIYKMC